MEHALSTKRPGPRSLRPFAFLGLMTLVQIVGTAAILSLTALAPSVAAELRVGAHWIGYQISLIYFVGMLTSAFAGSIVAFWRPERIIPAELVMMAAGLGLLSLGRIDAIVLASVLFGAAYGLNNPASSEILSRETPVSRRSLVYSVKQSGVPLGAVVANTGLPLLTLCLGGSWQMAMLLAAVVPLMLAVFSMVMMPCPPRGLRPGFRGIWRGLVADQGHILRNPAQRTLAALGGLYSAMQLTVTAFSAVALVDQGWHVVEAGMVGAALQFAGALGRVGWGLVGDRLGGFRTLALIGALSATFSLLLGFGAALGHWLQIGIMVALGAVAVGWNGVFLALAARSAPEGRIGANTGAILVYTFIGVILGPSLFAVIYQSTGSYQVSFMLFAIPGIVGAIIAAGCARFD